MATYPRRFFLLPAERILIEARMARAWALEHFLASLIFGLVVWGGLTIVVLLAQPPSSGAFLTLIAVAAIVHFLVSALYVWRRIVTSEYVVTDEAVYTRRGRFLLNVGVAALDRVTDLHVRTGIIGRLFGYSALSVRTAGGGVYLPGLRDPYTIRGVVQQSRHEFIARLLRESGRQARTAAPAAAPVSRCECPTCHTVITVPAPRPIDVECPNCHEKGMLFEEAVA